MRPGAITVSTDRGCEEVVRALREAGATQALVVDAQRCLVGILTEQDVTRRVAFEVPESTPVEQVMTAPVTTVRADDLLYEAIEQMRRAGLRHMPVIDGSGVVVGVLHLDDALIGAAAQTLERIQRLTRGDDAPGLRGMKAAQAGLAGDLLRDDVPAVEVQSLLSRINNEIHRRVVRLSVDAMQAHGPAPAPFDVLILGSGGRGESLLRPVQANALVFDGGDAEADAESRERWFEALAGRVTRSLYEVGFPYCPGDVMVTNRRWRKSASGWQQQVDRWIGKGEGQALRMCDIFFDFAPVFGAGKLARDLRRHVMRSARRAHFLRELFKIDEAHGVALGLFGRLQRDPLDGPHRGEVNLKLTGTLPLVGAVRVLALREGIEATSTRGRMGRLAKKGILSPEELDRLGAAFRLLVHLNLRQQLRDVERDVEPGNHVPVESLSRRERRELVAGFRAIRAFRARVRGELAAELF